MKKPVFEYCRECIYLKGKSACRLCKEERCEDGCTFHMTKEQRQASEARSFARLNSLDDEEQIIIAEKYYDGEMPWRKA